MYPKDTLMRIVVLSLLLYSIVSLAVVAGEMSQLKNNTLVLEQQLLELVKENTELEEKLTNGIDDAQMLQLARSRLGLVLPSEKVFYFTTDREG